MTDLDLVTAATRLAILTSVPGAVAIEALRTLAAEGFVTVLPVQSALVPAEPAVNAYHYASKVVLLINELTGRRFKVGDQDKTRAQALIRAKVPLTTMLAMVEYMHGLWSKDPKMVEYIQPSTLMRLTKARDYIAKMEAGPARPSAVAGFRRLGDG